MNSTITSVLARTFRERPMTGLLNGPVLVENIEDKALLAELLQAMEKELPAPKKKKK